MQSPLTWYSGMYSLTLNISPCTTLWADTPLAAVGLPPAPEAVAPCIEAVLWDVVKCGVLGVELAAALEAGAELRLARHTAFQVSRGRCMRLSGTLVVASSQAARPSLHLRAEARHSSSRQLRLTCRWGWTGGGRLRLTCRWGGTGGGRLRLTGGVKLMPQ